MKRIIIILLMSLLLIGQAYFLGYSDKVSLLLFIITTILLFFTLNRLQSLAKKSLRPNTKKGSLLYYFLSKDPNIFMKIWVTIIALIFSGTMIIFIKGIVIKHGYFVPFLIIVIVSAILYTFINQDFESNVFDKNLDEDVAAHSNEMIRIFFAAILINIVLALTFSAYDAHKFATTNININNFQEKAINDRIIETNDNNYTRLPINAYILAEKAKIALTSEVVNHFKLFNSYYLFYAFSFILNLLKMTLFSMTIVLIQRSLDKRADNCIIIINKIKYYTPIYYRKMLYFINTYIKKDKNNKIQEDIDNDKE